MESKLGLNMELVNQARQSAAHVAAVSYTHLTLPTTPYV